MLLDILYIMMGGFLVIWGADRLTDGSVSVAERLNVPQIIIGLTIVAFGTSMPEFCVSLVSALQGTSDLAVGNIVGSNIFNGMAIVGVAAMISPMAILKSSVKKDIPFAVLASVLLAVMCGDGEISRMDAFLLLLMFVGFMAYTLRAAKHGSSDSEGGQFRQYSLPKSLLFIVLGLACLVLGSQVFVNGATGIARELGVSEAIIGLTIVAIGTSLPELATSAVSASKGQSGIAIGNVIGSNVFNVLFILGTTGVICPMSIAGITVVDLAVLVGSILILWLFAFTKYVISAREGALLTICYVGYMAWLVWQAL